MAKKKKKEAAPTAFFRLWMYLKDCRQCDLLVLGCLVLVNLIFIDSYMRTPLLGDVIALTGHSQGDTAKVLAHILTLFMSGCLVLMMGNALVRFARSRFGIIAKSKASRIFGQGVRDEHKATGWIYVLYNKSMPSLYKVGYTSGSPYKRAKQLDTTGVPTSFKVIWCCRMDFAEKIEHETHRALDVYRVRGRREFFKTARMTICRTILSARLDVLAAYRRCK